MNGIFFLFFRAEATRIPEKRVKSTTTYLPLVPRGRRSLEGLILEKLIEKRAPLEKVQYETDCCSFETSDVEKLKSPENWKIIEIDGTIWSFLYYYFWRLFHLF